jgi:hypothetical protein
MLRHHEIELAQFVETIWSDAAASVRWDRLYRWFGADRISKTVWQTIYARWADMCEEMGYDGVPELTCIKLPNSFTVTRKPLSYEEAVHLTEEGAQLIE